MHKKNNFFSITLKIIEIENKTYIKKKTPIQEMGEIQG